MKKIIIIATLIAFGTLTAQTEKGTFLISGRSGINFASKQINIEADSQQSNNSKINSFSITPSFAYFVVNNFALGLSLDYTYEKNRQQFRYPLSYLYDVTNTNTFQTSEVKTINSTFSIMPSATYFFSKGKAKPYIGAGLGYANNNNEYSVTVNNDPGAYSYLKSSSNLDAFIWNVNGGFAYFVTKSVGFNFGLSYSELSFKESDVKINSSTFGANIGVLVSLK